MKKFLGIICMTVFLGSCQNDSTTGHSHAGGATDDAHQHDAATVAAEEEESETLTLYSDKLEVFIQHPRLFVGHEAELLIYVTRLDEGYAPYRGASFDLMLTIDGFGQFTTAHASDTRGVYHANLVPEMPGMAALSLTIPLDGGNVKLATDHIHIYDEGAEVHHHETGDVASIRFSKLQAWNSDFEVIPVKLKNYGDVITASGELMAMPGEKHHVIAKSDGVVLFETRNLVQGHYVEKGEVLFTISGQGMADNNIRVRFNEAKTNFRISKTTFERHKVLLQDQAISEKQYLTSENQYVNDSILYHSLLETVEDDGMKIKAPMNGYIHEMNVSEGQFVKSGSLMATISTNKVMLLRADVPQHYFAQLNEIVSTHFRTAYSERVYTLEELSGKLIARGASVAENNHYMPVYFEVVNDGSLLEGAFGEFYLMTDGMTEKIVIPAPSLVEEQGNYYVYVQLDGETYEKRPVILLGYDGINAAVLKGLAPGERVVSKGAMLVKSASSAAIPSHNHSH